MTLTNLANLASKLAVALLLAGSVVVSGCASSGSSSNAKDTTKSQQTDAKPAKVKNSPSAVQSAALQRRESTIDARGKVTRTGEVYLLRGLANVFSRGMDVMGRRMVKKGLDARVFNHAAWRELADNILAREVRGMVSHPIIIMGHSLGANASVQMAKYLGDRGVKVRYVVAFDPTITTYAARNVSQITNYYLPNDDKSNIVKAEPGFKGKLRNEDMTKKNPDITHMNIEKNPKLQKTSIDYIMGLTKKVKSKRKRIKQASR